LQSFGIFNVLTQNLALLTKAHPYQQKHALLNKSRHKKRKVDAILSKPEQKNIKQKLFWPKQSKKLQSPHQKIYFWHGCGNLLSKNFFCEQTTGVFSAKKLM
jgi:hypothetical protein